VDPLADATRCGIDIPLMKQALTNTIRVYAVDPTKDHTACMNLLIQNNIYVFADLSEPGMSINRDSPAWTDQLYERYTSVVDMFSKYDNVIGFFAGNEVSNALNNTAASAFVRAAVRDTKAYIKAKNYRPMYVGYATSDDAEIRIDMADYFNCGDPASAIDFWGYNIYSWCGQSSFTESGYDQRVAQFANYSVPSFFAEYGCNLVEPRQFTEVQALFGPNMTDVFSGGIVYMYFEEANNYGLVTVPAGGTAATPLPDFTNLASQMALVNPTGVLSSQYKPTNVAQACPPVASGVWAAKASPLPPTPNQELCSCMTASLSCNVQSTVDPTAYGTLFGTVCGYGGGAACAGIKADPSTGTYGAYSMCSPQEQLGFVFNQYYQSQNSAATACNFQGAAKVQQGASPASSCTALLNQAGAQGTGTVTSQPTGGSGGSSGSGKKSGAGAVGPSLGLMLGAWVLVSGMAGAGLILL
jgi:hypothetical protein